MALRTSQILLEGKAVLCMFKGCLAWVKGDLPQCQKEYDDAAAACKERVKIAGPGIESAELIIHHYLPRRQQLRKQNSSQAE